MGYQESLLFAPDTKSLTRLCKYLNKTALDKGEEGLKQIGLEVFEIARLKKELRIMQVSNEVPMVLPTGSYFVWWGGERGAQADWLDHLNIAPTAIPFKCIFADYVRDAMAVLEGIEEGRPGEMQENEWIRTFHPSEEGQIDLSLIEQL